MTNIDELRHNLFHPDEEVITRRDNVIRLFNENVCISRNGVEVTLVVDESYMRGGRE